MTIFRFRYSEALKLHAEAVKNLFSEGKGALSDLQFERGSNDTLRALGVTNPMTHPGSASKEELFSSSVCPLTSQL